MEQNRMAQLEREKAAGLQQSLQQLQGNAGNLVETGPGGGAKYGLPSDTSGEYARVLSQYYPEKGLDFMLRNQLTQPQIGLMNAQAKGEEAKATNILEMLAPNKAKTWGEAGKLEAERATELRRPRLMGAQERHYGAEADKTAAQTANIKGEFDKGHNTVSGLNSLFADMNIPLIEVDPNKPVDANFLTDALRARLGYMGVKEGAESRERVAGDKDEKALFVQAVNLAKSQLSTLTQQIDKLEAETGGVNAMLDEPGTLAKRQSLAVLKGEYERKLRETEAMSKAALDRYGLKISIDDVSKPLLSESPAAGGSSVWKTTSPNSLVFTGKPGAR
jgi:hypothetical protein